MAKVTMRETVDGAIHESWDSHPEWDEPIDLTDGATVYFICNHTDFFSGHSWRAGESAKLTKPEAERALYEGHGSLKPVRKLRSLRSFRDSWIKDNFNEFAPERGCNMANEVYYATQEHAIELMKAGYAVDWDEWEAAEVKPKDLYVEVAEKFLSGEYK